jgi:hypothetical protein
MKKIYITSTNLSGKGFLMQLLDGHPSLILVPYHKFTISSIAKNLLSELSKERAADVSGYYQVTNATPIELINPFTNSTLSLEVGELVHFLLSRIPPIKFLIHAGYSNTTCAFSGDDNKTEAPFEFDFPLFVSSLIDRLTVDRPRAFSIEDLEDTLFWAFRESYNSPSLSIDPSFVVYPSNGAAALSELFQVFDNLKVLLVMRSPLSIAYANAKRILAETNRTTSDQRLFEFMRGGFWTTSKKVRELRQASLCPSTSADHLLPVSFNDLFLNRRSAMKKIADFLEIEFIDELLTPSICGQPIDFDEIVDHPTDLLSSSHLKRLERLYAESEDQADIADYILYLWDYLISTIVYCHSTGFWRR